VSEITPWITKLKWVIMALGREDGSLHRDHVPIPDARSGRGQMGAEPSKPSPGGEMRKRRHRPSPHYRYEHYDPRLLHIATRVRSLRVR